MATSKQCLLAVLGGPVAFIPALSAVLTAEGVDMINVHALNGPTNSAASSSKYAVVLSVGGYADRDTLTKLAALLQPGGNIYVLHGNQDAANIDNLKNDLLLSGYTGGESVTLSGVPLVKSQKPSWESGTKTALTLKKKPATAQPAHKAWTLDGGDELMDDDELLTEADRVKPVVAAASDCATSKKACKNCSCGRAEAEAAAEAAPVKLTAEQLENPTSNCGSCALGDAFRCASCPYRGLPAFELGKKINLGGDLLAADLK